MEPQWESEREGVTPVETVQVRPVCWVDGCTNSSTQTAARIFQDPMALEWGKLTVEVCGDHEREYLDSMMVEQIRKHFYMWEKVKQDYGVG